MPLTAQLRNHGSFDEFFIIVEGFALFQNV